MSAQEVHCLCTSPKAATNATVTKICMHCPSWTLCPSQDTFGSRRLTEELQWSDWQVKMLQALQLLAFGKQGQVSIDCGLIMLEEFELQFGQSVKIVPLGICRDQLRVSFSSLQSACILQPVNLCIATNLHTLAGPFLQSVGRALIQQNWLTEVISQCC